MRLRIPGAYIFVISMVVIAGLTISYNNYVAGELKKNEVNYVQIWAKAQQALVNSQDGCDYTFHFDVVEKNTTIPIMLVDEEGTIIDARNFSKPYDGIHHLSFFESKKIELMEREPILIGDDNFKQRLYYDTSNLVKSLEQFPYLQLLVFIVLVVFSLFILSTRRKMEQERVWVGMAKETAHQLGTPLSSLMGWHAHLEQLKIDPMITGEMKKDLHRLERITDRFSKIGSESKLEDSDIIQTIEQNLIYLKARLSKKVEINFESFINEKTVVLHNQSLIDWVIENLCKNSVDAMGGVGNLKIMVSEEKKNIHIDVSDSGKGIPLSDQNAIFDPGYSTKKRGCGLGLALVKRIVCEHHKGKVFVLKSKLGEGTTIRISLPLETLS